MKKTFKNILKVSAGILLITIYMAIILVCGKQALNYFYNEYVLDNYYAKDYSINENLLLTANYIEPYIVYYNNGNISYKNAMFEDAIENYESALEINNIPEERECSIRINLALAKIALLPEDYDSEENVEDSIETLEEAREDLLAKSCAKDKGKGHSKKAQELKGEIDDELEKLEEIKDKMDQAKKAEGKKSKEQREEERRQQEEFRQQEAQNRADLEEIAEDAYKERQIELEEYEENDIDWWNADYDFNGIW